jgi:hypothetical protein
VTESQSTSIEKLWRDSTLNIRGQQIKSLCCAVTASIATQIQALG